MSDTTATPEQEHAIQRAIAVLRDAGIAAEISEHWRGGERRYVIVLCNLSNVALIEKPPG